MKNASVKLCIKALEIIFLFKMRCGEKYLLSCYIIALIWILPNLSETTMLDRNLANLLHEITSRKLFSITKLWNTAPGENNFVSSKETRK